MLEVISVGHTLSNFEPGEKKCRHGPSHTHIHRISIWHQNSNLRSAYNLRSSYNLRSAYGNLRSAYNLRLAYDLI